MDVETQAFLTHNWGKVIPSLHGATANQPAPEPKYDNHEKVAEVNERLTRLGLNTWFDSERLGGDNVKEQLIKAIDKTKVLLVFITKDYQNKVNTADTNDYCYFELNYAILRLTSKRMIAIVMDEDMKDTKQWEGRLLAELGNHLYIDLTTAFENFQRYSDDSLLQKKCQEIYDKVQKVISDNFIPIRNPDQKMIELFNLPYQYTWIKPFFENSISKDADKIVLLSIHSVYQLLRTYEFMNDYFQTLNYKDIIIRILKRNKREINPLTVNSNQEDTRISIFEAFLSLLTIARGCLVTDILSAINQLLLPLETVPPEEEQFFDGFIAILFKAEIIVILGQLIKDKESKMIESKRELVSYLSNIFLLASILMKESQQYQAILLRLNIFEEVETHFDLAHPTKVFLIKRPLLCELHHTILDGALNENWTKMGSTELQFLLKNMIPYISDKDVVLSSLKSFQILGQDEENAKCLYQLAYLQDLKTILNRYETSSTEILVEAITALTVVAQFQEYLAEIKSNEFLLFLIMLLLKNQSDFLLLEGARMLSNTLKLSRSSADSKDLINSSEMQNAVISCIFRYFVDPSEITLSALYDLIFQITVSTVNQAIIQVFVQCQLGDILVLQLQRIQNSSKQDIHSMVNTLSKIYFSMILLSEAHGSFYDLFANGNYRIVERKNDNGVVLSLHFYMELFETFNSSSDISDATHHYDGAFLSLLVNGFAYYFKDSLFLEQEIKVLQTVLKQATYAVQLASIFPESLSQALDYYKDKAEFSHLTVELLITWETLLNAHLDLMKLDLTAMLGGFGSVFVDLISFHYSEAETVAQRTNTMLAIIVKIISHHTGENIIKASSTSARSKCVDLLTFIFFHMKPKDYRFDKPRLLKLFKSIYKRSSTVYEIMLDLSYRRRSWTVFTYKLRKQSLEYYDGEKLLGTIDITNSTSMKIPSKEADGKPFQFSVSVYNARFNASCEEVRAHCIEMFNNAGKEVSSNIMKLFTFFLQKGNHITLHDLSDQDVFVSLVSSLDYTEDSSLISDALDLLNCLSIPSTNRIELAKISIIGRLFRLLALKSKAETTLLIISLLNRFIILDGFIELYFCQREVVEILCDIVSSTTIDNKIAFEATANYLIIIIENIWKKGTTEWMKSPLALPSRTLTLMLGSKFEFLAIICYKVFEIIVMHPESKVPSSDVRFMIHQMFKDKGLNALQRDDILVVVGIINRIMKKIYHSRSTWLDGDLLVDLLTSLFQLHLLDDVMMRSLLETTVFFLQTTNLQLDGNRQSKLLQSLITVMEVHFNREDLVILAMISFEQLCVLKGIHFDNSDLTLDQFGSSDFAQFLKSIALADDMTSCIGNIHAKICSQLRKYSIETYLNHGLNSLFSISSLFNVLWSIIDIKSNVVPLEHFVTFVPLEELFHAFSVRQLQEAGFSTEQLKEAGFSAGQFKEARFSAKQLKEEGFKAKQLQEARFNVQQLKEAGFSAEQLRDVGFNVQQLKEAGFSAEQLRDVGFNVRQFRKAGFSAEQLREVGFSAEQLKEAWFSAKQFREAGFDVSQLQEAGFSERKLRKIGFSL